MLAYVCNQTLHQRVTPEQMLQRCLKLTNSKGRLSESDQTAYHLHLFLKKKKDLAELNIVAISIFKYHH